MAEWIGAGAAVAAVLIVIIGGYVAIIRSLDKNTAITQSIKNTQDAQWHRLDSQGEKIEDHNDRLVVLETKFDMHEERHYETIK